jgi:hypothetical protein
VRLGSHNSTAIPSRAAQTLPRKIDSLRYFHSQMSRYKRWLSLELDVIDVAGPIRPSDLEHIAETPRRHQSSLNLLVLDEHIGNDGRTINQLIQFRDILGRLGQHAVNTV